MSVYNISGVFIRVKNIEKTIDFYTKQLGLRVRDLEGWEG
ncbi:VOC family protein [Bacillus sp. sid0103]|nr:VOC family protein [Bacillus sp. sid0103]